MRNKLNEIVERFHKFDVIRHIYAKKITASFGLYLGQLPVMEFVAKHNGCTQKQIADEMGITPASIAISAKRMEKAGLLERTTDQNNLRCNKLFITSRGLELAHKCRGEFDKLDIQMFSGFSEDNIKQLRNYLDKLIENISGEELADKSIFSLIALRNELDQKQKKTRGGR